MFPITGLETNIVITMHNYNTVILNFFVSYQCQSEGWQQLNFRWASMLLFFYIFEKKFIW